MGSAVDIVSEEEVLGEGQFTAHLEDFQYIEELSVDISADGDGSLNGLDVGLFEEEGLDAAAEGTDGGFGDDLALEHLFNECVYVHYKK